MDEEIKEIDDIDEFVCFVRSESFKIFLKKLNMITSDIYESEDDICLTEEDKEFIKTRLVDVEILSDMEPFVLQDERDNMYMLKEDLITMIIIISNDIIGRYLNNLVDKGVLQMCWEPERKEFIWVTGK